MIRVENVSDKVAGPAKVSVDTCWIRKTLGYDLPQSLLLLLRFVFAPLK